MPHVSVLHSPCWSLKRISNNAGSVEDVGVGDGRHYSVNVPLQEGMDDESYRFMFEPIMQKVSCTESRSASCYRPKMPVNNACLQ